MSKAMTKIMTGQFSRPRARVKRRAAVAVALLILLVGVFALFSTETGAADLSPVYLTVPRDYWAVEDNDRVYIPITLENSGPDPDGHPHVVSLEAVFLADGAGGFATGFSQNEFGTPLSVILAPDQTPVTNGVNVPRGAANKVIVYLWVAAPNGGSDLAAREIQVNGNDNYGLVGDSNITRQKDGLALVLYVQGVKLEDGEIALDEFNLEGDKKLYQGQATDWNFTLQNTGFADQTYTVAASAIQDGSITPAANWTFDFQEQGGRASSDGSYALEGMEKSGEALLLTYVLTITPPYHAPLGLYDIQLLLTGANVSKTDRTTSFVQPLTVIEPRAQEEVTITVDVWNETDGTARVDFLDVDDLTLQVGQTIKVDRDGDGDDDTEVTLTGFDTQGRPEISLVPIAAAADEDDDWLGAWWCLPLLLLLILLLLILLYLSWYRRPAVIAALPPALPPLPLMLASVGEQMEHGWFYFVDEHGNIARVDQGAVKADQKGDDLVTLRRKIGLDSRPMCMIYYKDIDPDLIMPAPVILGKGKVSNLNLQREPGWFYYIDKDGHVSRSRMARGTAAGGGRELVMRVGLVREPEWFYFIDKDGDISRTRRVLGGKEKVMGLDETDEGPASVPMAGIEPWRATSVGVWMEPDRFYFLDANNSIVSALIHDGHRLERKEEVVIKVLEDTDHGYFVLHYYPEPKLVASPAGTPPKPAPESPAAALAPPGLCLKDFGLKKEPGYFYYVDSDGHISRNKMARGEEPAGPREQMARTGIVRETGWLYYVNKGGCIDKARMRRGPAKSKVPEEETPRNPAPPKLCLKDFGLKKEPGYFYYLDADGHISRNKMARGEEPAGPRELMARTGIVRETGWLYYVNKAGCIDKARMRRGPARPKPNDKQ